MTGPGTNGKLILGIVISLLGLFALLIGRNAVKSDLAVSTALEAAKRVAVIEEREQNRYEALMRELEKAERERAELKRLLLERE